MTRKDLYLVPVPEATESYSPVSHKNIIRKVETQLHKKDMEIASESFNVGRDGNQLIGYMDIRHTSSNELGMRIAYRNSYDKSMSVAFVAGSNVWICGNGCISGEIQYVQKHTGSVLSELREKINITVNELEQHFIRMLLNQQEQMREIQFGKRDCAELAGRLFIETELVSAQQLSIIKREIVNPTFEPFKDNNLWSFYNYVTYAYKEAHPTLYLQCHTNFHKFITQEFSLQ
jgi:hypothetical protein